jgi:uncharacterized protein (DUF1330 family)
MPAYIIGQIRVIDPARFEQYRAAVPAVIAQYGGRYLVRGGGVTALEGAHDGRRQVVIEFPSREAAERFWHSPEYAAAKQLREGAAEVVALLVPGV